MGKTIHKWTLQKRQTASSKTCNKEATKQTALFKTLLGRGKANIKQLRSWKDDSHCTFFSEQVAVPVQASSSTLFSAPEHSVGAKNAIWPE